MSTLNELAERINAIAGEHGFWPTARAEALQALGALEFLDPPGEAMPHLSALRQYIEAQEVRNMGEMLMLAVSELAEGLEEHRDGKPVHYLRHQDECSTLDEDSSIMPGPPWCDCNPKPEGLAVELADCIIRCLDTMQSLGVDIDGIVREKMEYNDKRPFKHGKAF